jgi:hypothetical protein
MFDFAAAVLEPGGLSDKGQSTANPRGISGTLLNRYKAFPGRFGHLPDKVNVM